MLYKEFENQSGGVYYEIYIKKIEGE